MITLSHFLGQCADMFAAAGPGDMVIPQDLAAALVQGFSEARASAQALEKETRAARLADVFGAPQGGATPGLVPLKSNVVAFPVAPRITCFNRGEGGAA